MRIQLSYHFDIKSLLRFYTASILMMVFTLVYGVVDGFFVSNFVGKTSFAAVNFIMPFLMILGAFGVIVGTGGSALIGKFLGEGNREKANRVFSMLVYVSIVSGIALSIVGMVTIRNVALFLGADESMADLCALYGRIVLCGLPALMLQYEFQSFFVTAEKPQLGLYVTVASGLMNMVLDGVLVGLLKWGVPGAAVATVASQVVGGVLPLVYFARENESLLRVGKASFDLTSLLKTLGNGSSEFVSNISMSVVGMLYNVQLMKYAGEDGVAAYGVLMYVSMIFMAVFIGYSVAVAPVVSFHFGAKDKEELNSILRKSIAVIAVFAIMMLLAAEALAMPLAQLFVGYDETLVGITLHAFRIFSFSFVFCGVPIFGSSFFTGMNDGFTSAMISFMRTVVLQTAAVLILPMIMGLDGIWYSLIVAELSAAIVTIMFLWAKREMYTS